VTYEKYLETLVAIEAQVRRAADELGKHPKNELGLTYDHIKATPKYIADKCRYDLAFEALRRFNGQAPTHFKRRRADEAREAKQERTKP